MLIFIQKKHVILCLVLLLILASVIGTHRAVKPVFDVSSVTTIIIDPGHGGMDPGAIGITGVSEKDVNLSVSLFLEEYAKKAGYNIVMTRESDCSLHDENAKNKKRSDLQNRKKRTDEIQNAVFVSIHMNKFEQSSVRGAQVFYAETEESKDLAEMIQNEIGKMDENNQRHAMQIPKSVFLLQNVKRPTVLIEGGFLSNPEEERMLTDKTYQKKLAETILNGIGAYLYGEETP